jgi:hypothetical protein
MEMVKMFSNNDLQRRFISVVNKVKLLSTLRESVGLSFDYDITDSQWKAIESPLLVTEAKLQSCLKKNGSKYLKNIHLAESQRDLTILLGRTELELSKTFIYFDTFVDLLSQRHLPEVGLLLGGCDVLAWDSLKKDYPALSIIEKPLVSFNRGFGASILREGVALPDGTLNPLATIQIPYTKIRAKYNLTSIVHEAGHLAMAQLGLINVLPEALSRALRDNGAPELIRKLFALWCMEIGPDFWGFCNCGIAQASSVMEILSLPPEKVFRVSFTDPHPPPYLRVLLAFEWCRQKWGSGEWDDWEAQWLNIYPLEDTTESNRKVLTNGKKYIPAVSRVLLKTQFDVLDKRTIPSLFDFGSIDPTRLKRFIREADRTGYLDLSELSPCGQLALFRMLRNKSNISEQSLDRLMSAWLISLAKGRKFKEQYS